jgi:hypothetical protein
VAVPDPVTTGLVTAGALQIAKQAQEFIAAAAGHPGESIATILGSMANRRLKNAEAVGSKSHLILLDIGIRPREIPLDIWQPALEAASLQEDEFLQDTWANLLANAADPRQTTPVTASFTTILKDFTIREVKFLDALYDVVTTQPPPYRDKQRITEMEFEREPLLTVYTQAGLSRRPSLTYKQIPTGRSTGQNCMLILPTSR